MKQRFTADLEKHKEEDLRDYDTKDNSAVYDIAHIAILDANEKLTEELGKTPSFDQIAKRAGVHVQTVYRHYRKLRMVDIKPRYKKVVFEVLNRHIELMRQNDNPAVALKACLALEERLFDMIPKAEIEVIDTEKKKLVIEIEDRRQELVEKVEDAEIVEIINED